MKPEDDDPTPRELIIALRGGVPRFCDFCLEERDPERLHPEEGGEWVCNECLKRWKEQENET